MMTIFDDSDTILVAAWRRLDQSAHANGTEENE
jgi:hypothetical protein